jgi:CheY-like chemotaxis protein/cell division septation protein DedD
VGPKRKILVVDDDRAVRDLFVRTLEPGGFEVVAVENADEGIETAKQIEPDIIYLSLLFPESNGLKVGKSLHSVERLKEIPIVVLISYRGELDPKYTKTIGIVDVLVKPLNPAGILGMTARLLGEEISSEPGEPSSLLREGEEGPGAVEKAALISAGSGVESMSEESEYPAASEEQEIVEETEEIGDEDRRPGQSGESSGESDWSAPDFKAGDKEDREDGAPADVRNVKKDDDIIGFLSEEESTSVEREGAGDTVESHDSEGRVEAGNRPIRRYILITALTLLVAAVVFAVLQAGILPGSHPGARVSPEVVKGAPVKKETVREDIQSVKPGSVEERGKTENVPPLRESPAGKGLAASEPSVERKGIPAAGRSKPPLQRGTSAVNEGLKEPKALKGQRKEVYSVQVGAFAEEGNAISVAEKLKKRGYDSFVEKRHGEGLHRVLVGRFDDYKKARRQSEVLLQKDGIKSIIYRH